MTKLPFYDISNNNGPGIIDRALTGIGFIAKCTEGLTFRDGLYHQFIAAGRSRGQCLGSYHFAHWRNDPRREAAFYAANNDRHDGEFEILDWEMYGSQADCPASVHGPWVAEFLRARPLAGLYTNTDMMNKIVASASAADLAVIRSRVFWKATVGGATPGNDFGFKNGVSLWQWRDTQGIDEDWSFLTPEQWRAYANGNQLGDDVGNVDTISADAAKAIARYVWTQIIDEAPDGQSAASLLGQTFTRAGWANTAAGSARDGVAALSANLDAVAQKVAGLAPGLSADDVKQALAEALAESVKVTGELKVEQPSASA